MPVKLRECSNCKKRYALLSRMVAGSEELSALDNDDIENLRCPQCGNEGYRTIVASATGVELGGEAGATSRYPRWDNGLGCWVKSKDHLKQLLTHVPLDESGRIGPPRDIPLIQTHGDRAMDEHWDRTFSQTEEDEKRRKREREEEAYKNREAYDKLSRVLADQMSALKRGEDSIFKRRPR